ncbi:MAM and LDL-receptor class A domain-containing protein 1-like [Glandiceps talaboti]
MCSFVNDTKNDFDWSSQKAVDVTNGPDKDHSFNSENDYFLYLEVTSETGSGKIARLLSPQLGATDVNGKCLLFWYYTTGSIGKFTVYVNYTSEFPGEQPYWVLEGSSTNDWLRGFVPVVSTVEYNIIFEIVSSDSSGAIAIDDVRFTTDYCDISPSSAVPPPMPLPKTATPSPPASSTYDCTFEFNMCSWTQSTTVTDDVELVLTKAKNNEDHGPVTDHTTGTGDGSYIYVETESRSTDDVAQIISDVIAGTSQSCVTFWYHIYGTHVNTLNIYKNETGDITTRTKIWTRQGNQLDEWLYGSVHLSSPNSFQIIFEAESGSGHHGDIALDDITFNDGDCPNSPHYSFECDFEGEGSKAWCGWENEPGSDVPWKLGTGATRDHPEIGPPVDSTTRTEFGHYIYVDASEMEEGQYGSVNSPGIIQWDSKSVKKCVIFYYHHWHDAGTMAVYKEYDYQGVTYRRLFAAAIGFTWGNNWVRAGSPLSYYETPNVPFKWIYENWVGASEKGDMALDDLYVKDGNCPGRG